MGIQTARCAVPLIETTDGFADDVISGLSARPKQLSPKYFYDAVGSALFDRIVRLPEYYPTRCELRILRDHAPDIASQFPSGCALVEFGAGSSRKARVLLAAAAGIEAYVPVDISGDFLRQEAARLRRDFPRLAVHPIVADFTKPFEVPPALAPRVGFFPGSTLGNFEPREAVKFLRQAGELLGHDSLFVIGVDLVKAPDVLSRAYNDAAGITAAFNLNLLTRINRELGANFDLSTFEHRAFYNGEQGRIEMHLVSTQRQEVHVNGTTIEFRAGETIHTENSYKYTIESFEALARAGGWQPLKTWTDGLFCVQALVNQKTAGREKPEHR